MDLFALNELCLVYLKLCKDGYQEYSLLMSLFWNSQKIVCTLCD